jgi:hypothetical protein
LNELQSPRDTHSLDIIPPNWNFFNPNSFYDIQNNLFSYNGMSCLIRIPLDMVNSPRLQSPQLQFDAIHNLTNVVPIVTCCFNRINNLQNISLQYYILKAHFFTYFYNLKSCQRFSQLLPVALITLELLLLRYQKNSIWFRFLIYYDLCLYIREPF